MKRVGKLCGHKDSVNALDFGGNLQTLASASDEAARMWDLTRLKASRCFIPPGTHVFEFSILQFLAYV